MVASWQAPDDRATGIGAGLVKKKEEEALITVMKERALLQCKEMQKEYYECVKGRMVSVAWACRGQATAMSKCLGEHTSDAALADLKSRWGQTNHSMYAIMTPPLTQEVPLTQETRV